MADETTDVSNREQFVLVLRHVDDDLIAHELFFGLYKVDSIDSDILTKIIEDCLLRMNLSVNNCRGQCYDGASNMSGAKNGVAKKISDKEQTAVYTHCYGHALNLAVGDTVKRSKIMRDALDTTYEMSKLVKFSPKRDSLFERLKQELAPETPGFRTLCPTRWTVRANNLQSVVDNYEVLQDLLGESYSSVKETDTGARNKGVDAQMKSFDFLFGVMLGQSVLAHTDNLSKALQHQDL
ncbi:zinc finger MYM-type protein 1-like [Mercenaria mercenaria]|uniref:zinc finger MYM-type protein 1-like n=1 Tax=Mercenaria mercenaria TaxID=6596 RepID=UPI00234E44DB|nr:zinc finger MYM-type protein 1-like [Mercenaria mercenaria]